MKRGFYTIMSAQFFSSLADNALFVTAVELLKSEGTAEWQRAALVPMFALFYVVLAPFVGAFADSRPKGDVMLMSNTIKVVGCLMMLFGSHPLLAYAVVGLGAAAYSPAKYGILTELLPSSQLVKANGWIEGLTIGSIILGVLLGGQLVGPQAQLDRCIGSRRGGLGPNRGLWAEIEQQLGFGPRALHPAPAPHHLTVITAPAGGGELGGPDGRGRRLQGWSPIAEALIEQGLTPALQHPDPARGMGSHRQLQGETSLKGHLGQGMQGQHKRGLAQQSQLAFANAIALGQRIANQLTGQQSRQQRIERRPAHHQQLRAHQGWRQALIASRLGICQVAGCGGGLPREGELVSFDRQSQTALLDVLQQGGHGAGDGAQARRIPVHGLLLLEAMKAALV